tara:strand:- start:503 stop:4555 length:4053 start_codon:yes stop_codon:yes gene_type:complete
MSTRYIGGLVYNPPGGWSGSFSGTGQYLTLPSNSAFAFGTGDFTVECWAYFTSVASFPTITDSRASTSSTAGFNLGLSSAKVQLYTTSQLLIGATTLVVNTWYHIAITRSGTTLRIWLNGVQDATTTNSTNWSDTTFVIGATPSAVNLMTGYISNVRLVKGTAVYTSTFTPPTGALLPITNTSLLTCRYPTFVDGSTNNFTVTNVGSVTAITSNPFPTTVLPNPALGGAGNGIYTLSQYASLRGAGTWPAIDPYYKSVVLNLHGNAGTVLPFNTDASTNNFQVTQVGDTKPSNFTPFIANGYWSNAFDGSGDYLSVASNAAFGYGTGDFSLEFWAYPFTSSDNNRVIFHTDDNFNLELINSGGSLLQFFSGSARTSSPYTYTTNTWNHCAITRQSGTARMFINGRLVNNFAFTSSKGTSAIQLGANAGASQFFNGYLSNIRIVKGGIPSAYVTSSTTNGTQIFTPSTVPLTVSDSLTGGSASLITSQSNRFIDNSANAFTVTPSGNAAVNPFQPFTAPTGTSAYGSGFFDGSGDRLVVSGNSAFNFSTGDFTVECWVYLNSVSANQWIVGPDNTSTYPWVLQTTGTAIRFISNNAANDFRPTSFTLTTGNWNHFAVTRSGSTMYWFTNGTLNGTQTYSTAIGSDTINVQIGTTGSGSGDPLNGYISNLRVVKGTAVYTSSFTPSTTPLTAVTNTSLLTVQTNAPSQNNTFVDSSTNNFTITRNGNTTQGTFTPYGPSWSNYFNGSNAYWKQASSTNYTFGTNDFTIECWINLDSTSTSMRRIFGIGYGANGGSHGCTWDFRYQGTEGSAGQITLSRYDGSTDTQFTTSGATIAVNTWTHVAVSRTGGNLRIFVNGTAYYNAANTTNFSVVTYGGNTELWCGLGYYGPAGGLGGPRYFGGYMSNIRIINGTGIYSSNFTPPSAPLTAITNTQLLTAQSNRFVDNSTNAQAITSFGSVNVQRLNPFTSVNYYQPSVIGGSGFFDGSGDYLTLSPTSAFAFGTGDFTVETWLYPTAATGSGYIIDARNSGQTSTWSFNFAYGGTSSELDWGSSGAIIVAGNTTAVVVNQWNHIAYTRSGTTGGLYVNGTRIATATDNTNYSTSPTTSYIGSRFSATDFITGYFGDTRVVKGTAVYTGTSYTIPTAPLTAITNTSLLLSYTNAAIFDNGMINDLETVGSAQISTSIKKYGSASMYFDGSTSYLKGQSGPSYSLTGDFTIECWVYLTTASGTKTIFTNRTTGGAAGLAWVTQSGSAALSIYTNGGFSAASSTAITLNTWTHVALTRSGSTITQWLNGVSVATVSNSSSFTEAQCYIGANNSGTELWPGYIDDLRITKVARYTANFTPPTSQVQDQ